MEVSTEFDNRLSLLARGLGMLPQVEVPVKHYFTDNGLFAREIIIPQGTLAVGATHTEEFIEVFIEGVLLVPTENGMKEIKAPFTNVGKPGKRKIGIAVTDCKWVTFHNVGECRDIEKIMSTIIIEDLPKDKLCQQ